MAAKTTAKKAPDKKTAAKKSPAKSPTKSKTAAKKSTAARKPAPKETGHSAQPLTDYDEIREWAEERGARPACVKGTGRKGDVGMIRLDFPGYSGEDSLQEISWDEWFEQFDKNNLALIVQETTAAGEESNFNKLVKRAA